MSLCKAPQRAAPAVGSTYWLGPQTDQSAYRPSQLRPTLLSTCALPPRTPLSVRTCTKRTKASSPSVRRPSPAPTFVWRNIRRTPQVRDVGDPWKHGAFGKVLVRGRLCGYQVRTENTAGLTCQQQIPRRTCLSELSSSKVMYYFRLEAVLQPLWSSSRRHLALDSTALSRLRFNKAGAPTAKS